MDQDYDKLEDLEELFGSKIRNKELDPLDDGHLVSALLEKRMKLSFLERTTMLKKRISFFGIFAAGDNLEIVQAQYKFLKN